MVGDVGEVGENLLARTADGDRDVDGIHSRAQFTRSTPIDVPVARLRPRGAGERSARTRCGEHARSTRAPPRAAGGTARRPRPRVRRGGSPLRSEAFVRSRGSGRGRRRARHRRTASCDERRHRRAGHSADVRPENLRAHYPRRPSASIMGHLDPPGGSFDERAAFGDRCGESAVSLWRLWRGDDADGRRAGDRRSDSFRHGSASRRRCSANRASTSASRTAMRSSSCR